MALLFFALRGKAFSIEDLLFQREWLAIRKMEKVHILRKIGFLRLERLMWFPRISVFNNPKTVLTSVQNEQPHCDIRVRFSALCSPRHSLQVSFTVGVRALLLGGTPVTTVGL